MKNDLTAEQLRQEVTVVLPLSAVLRLGEEPPANVGAMTAATTREEFIPQLPEIGAPFGDGIYAGKSINGERMVALVLLPGDEELTWSAAMEWAEKQGGALPSRIDHLVLFTNLRGQFRREYYWAAEPYAGNESYAWYQSFYNGNQGDYRKGDELRARAVRRLPL